MAPHDIFVTISEQGAQLSNVTYRTSKVLKTGTTTQIPPVQAAWCIIRLLLLEIAS